MSLKLNKSEVRKIEVDIKNCLSKMDQQKRLLFLINIQIEVKNKMGAQAGNLIGLLSSNIIDKEIESKSKMKGNNEKVI